MINLHHIVSHDPSRSTVNKREKISSLYLKTILTIFGCDIDIIFFITCFTASLNVIGTLFKLTYLPLSRIIVQIFYLIINYSNYISKKQM